MSLRAKLDYLDPFGIAFIFGAVCCLLLALQWGGIQYAWNSSRVVGLLVGFVLLFAIFCAIQYKLGERATIPPRLLIHRTILFGSLSSLFITMSNNTVKSLDDYGGARLANTSTEIVLHALLLSGNQRCFCGVEWNQVSCSCRSSGCGHYTCRRFHNKDGPLCMSSPLSLQLATNLRV